jgi:hypothetical protein
VHFRKQQDPWSGDIEWHPFRPESGSQNPHKCLDKSYTLALHKLNPLAEGHVSKFSYLGKLWLSEPSLPPPPPKSLYLTRFRCSLFASKLCHFSAPPGIAFLYTARIAFGLTRKYLSNALFVEIIMASLISFGLKSSPSSTAVLCFVLFCFVTP